MFVWIGILLLAIAAFVAAYFASRTWHWANVTLMVMVFLSTVVYLALTSKVIQIRAVYGKKIARSTTELKDYEEQIRALKGGSNDSQVVNRLARDEINIPEGDERFIGVRDLDHQLHLRTRTRGRVWRGAAPTGAFDPETTTIPVAVESPEPHGIDANSIVVLFEQGTSVEGRRYLGDFRVTEANDGGVILRSVLGLDESQEERLAASVGPWELYESMPVDEHAIFEPLSDEQLQQLLPADSANQYVRHGGDRSADDDQWHIAAFDETGQLVGPESVAEAGNVTYRYQRALRDYSFLFSELARERIIVLADMAAVETDITRLTEALVGADTLRSFRQDELGKLKVDLAGVKKDLATIQRHLAELEQKKQVADRLLSNTLSENSRLARELAEFQQAFGAMIGQQAGLLQ